MSAFELCWAALTDASPLLKCLGNGQVLLLTPQLWPRF